MVKAWIIEIYRIRPRVIVPNIVSVDVESSRKYPLLNQSLISNCVAYLLKLTYIILWPISVPLSGCQIKFPSMEPDGRRPNPCRRLHSPHTQLATPGKAMANQFPVEQVFAVVDWQSWEVLEAGGDEEEVISYASN